jgi:iron complex outermembrane receptor protein
MWKEKPRIYGIRELFIGIVICFFILLFVSVSAAQEKEKKEQQTVLEDITVIGDRYINPVTPINTRYGTQYNLVTEEQIKEQNSQDFQSTLRDVPGIMFQSKNLIGSQTSHSLYIRGRGASHPSSDVVIEYDGVPRYGALFGQVLGDSIAVSTIGGIEVFKSPQPSEFGSGYAAVNVLPKFMTKEGYEIVQNFSGGSYYTFNESLSGGVKKGPYDVYASQSWVSTDGHTDHSRAQQQNYYANTGYQLNSMWTIRLLANYVNSQTVAPKPDVTPTSTNGVSWPGAERYDTETKFVTLTLNNQYGKANGYLKVYWNETKFDLLQELANGQRYARGTDGLWSRQEISLYGVRAKEKLSPWSGGQILAGVDLDMAELKNTQRTYSGLAVTGINGGLAERVWDFPTTTILSPYLALSQIFGRSEGFHVTPSAGIRYFNNDEFKDAASSQVGLVMGYGHTDLNINYSRGVNYPSPIVIMNMVVTGSTVTDPSQYWEKIKPEVVDHYEASLTHTWPKTASLGATAFYDKGKDRALAYMYGSIPVLFNDPVGKYEIRGLELTGSATLVKNLEFTAGATWLDSKATGNDGKEVEHLPYTPQFALQAGVNWKFLDNYRIFVDVQHFNNVYAGTSSRTGTFNYTDLTDTNKLDDITLCNARLSYRFDYKPLRMNDSEIFVAVNNIFDQDYEYAKGYKMPGITVFGGYSMKFN